MMISGRCLRMQGNTIGQIAKPFLGFMGVKYGSPMLAPSLKYLTLRSLGLAVIHMISIGIPFVAATQPINSLAFVFDGVNFGASDFAYSAYSMFKEGQGLE